MSKKKIATSKTVPSSRISKKQPSISKREKRLQAKTEKIREEGKQRLRNLFLFLKDEYNWDFGKTEQEEFERSPEDFFADRDRFGEKISLQYIDILKGIILEEYPINEALYGKLVGEDQLVEEVYRSYMDVDEFQAKYDSGELSENYVEAPMIFYDFTSNGVYDIVYSFKDKIFQLKEKYPRWLIKAMEQSIYKKQETVKERIESGEQKVTGEKSELIKGGFADYQTFRHFPRSQIEKGLIVEMEHTSDPEKALEIVLDHLAEYSNYYDRLEEAETKMQKDKTSKEKEIILMNKKLENWKQKAIDDFSEYYKDIFLIETSSLWTEEDKEGMRKSGMSEAKIERMTDKLYNRRYFLEGYSPRLQKRIRAVTIELAWNEETQQWEAY